MYRRDLRDDGRLGDSSKLRWEFLPTISHWVLQFQHVDLMHTIPTHCCCCGLHQEVIAFLFKRSRPRKSKMPLFCQHFRFGRDMDIIFGTNNGLVRLLKSISFNYCTQSHVPENFVQKSAVHFVIICVPRERERDIIYRGTMLTSFVP